MAARFLDIASDFGLKGETRERYVKYMLARWSNKEQLLCEKGFAREWAEHFATGHEFYFADPEGRRILAKIWARKI